LQVTGLAPVHAPAWHVSVCVQPLPSLHVEPFALLGLEHVPFAGLHVPATWHWSDAVHTSGVPAVQVPVWHVSLCVQALPSLHAVPFVAAGFEHVPFAGLQVPTTWHWSDAVQVTGFAPVQVPPWHVSVWVHPLPSVHVVPLAFVGFEHTPAEHVPATWHWSRAVQTTALPAQVPLVQTSAVVQALPSLQVVPFVAAGFEHVPFAGLQVPATWHWSEAVHVTGFVPVHVPLWHVSVFVHELPSLHAVPFVAAGFEHVPFAGSQVPATWHWSEAVHVTGLPPVHVPALHVAV
jgi:hypothetical protein